MARRREKKHPINDFFKRFGFICITFAALVGCAGVLYTVLHFINFSCPIKAIIGFDCPGCHLTRASAKLISFDFVGAWEENPIIYFIAGWIVLTAVRYLFCGNFKKIMSGWWIATLFIVWAILWIYLTFLR